MPQFNFRWLATLFFLPLWFTLAGCNKFEYSPNEVRLKDDELNLTAKNLARIEAMNLDQRSTVRFAVISDTQRFYDELDAAVDALKKRNDLDFVIITGDITDFGVTKEFRWINERMQQLSIPYLTVIGNHDCVGNGKKLYQAMFGPFDYTMNIGRNRFVFINTNSLEFLHPVPDLDFFAQALHDVDNFDNAFVFSHIAPYDNDFDQELAPEFIRISRDRKVRVSIHGHKHGHTEPKQYYGDGVEYLIVGSVERRGYQEITINNQQVEIKRIEF